MAATHNPEVISVTTWDPVMLTPITSFFTYFIETPLAKLAEKRRDEFKNLKIREIKIK